MYVIPICLESGSFPYYALKNHPEKSHAPEHSIETDERRGEAARVDSY
jgi:hypothetical protein